MASQGRDLLLGKIYNIIKKGCILVVSHALATIDSNTYAGFRGRGMKSKFVVGDGITPMDVSMSA